MGVDSILDWLQGMGIRRFWIQWWWLATLVLLFAGSYLNGWATRYLRHYERRRVRQELSAAHRDGRPTIDIRPVTDLREFERDDRGRYVIFLLVVIALLLAGILAQLVRIEATSGLL